MYEGVLKFYPTISSFTKSRIQTDPQHNDSPEPSYNPPPQLRAGKFSSTLPLQD